MEGGVSGVRDVAGVVVVWGCVAFLHGELRLRDRVDGWVGVVRRE